MPGQQQTIELSQVTAALLVGGFGTRLQSVVSDRPKPLAAIAGKPFLSYQFDQLAQSGVARVVLCTGFRGGQIEEMYGQQYGSLRLEYSLEPEPLGTGGALRFAFERLGPGPLLVMNGDSYCHAPLQELARFHGEHRSSFSLLLTHVPQTERFGQVTINEQQQITNFKEKAAASGPGYINAGVYLVDQAIINQIPTQRAVSLEREVFPQLVGGRFYGLQSHSPFLDIGTPESYASAAHFFATLPGLR